MKRFGLVLTVLAISVLLVQPCMGEGKVKADRTPLTFRDSGLYCNYNFFHGRDPSEDGVTNMLSAERAASKESPWAFYVMQYTAPEEPRPNQDTSLIKRMAQNGKKVILRAHIGRLSENPDVDKLEQRMINLFKEMDPDWLYAVTLGEEQVYWNGWAAALTELYHRVKKRWPDLPAYQWWTPMIAPDVRAKSGWVALPADGWVADLYGQPKEIFEKKVCKFLETGTPLVHIVWSSPMWPNLCGASSWDGGGRKVFDDQVQVCRDYNVPVAHFLCQNGGKDAQGNSYPIRWGWHCVDQRTRKWFTEVEAMIGNFKYLPAETMGYRALDSKKFAWARGGSQPVTIKFELDEQDRKRVSWRSNLSGVPTTAGEHLLATPHNNPYLRVVCVLDESATNLANSLGVGGAQGSSVRVPIVFRVEPKLPLAGRSVTAHIGITKALGGWATLACSSDGKDWSEPVAADPEKKGQTLRVELPGLGFSSDPFWVRLELGCSAGKKTNVCASLNSLEVAAAFEPPLETIAAAGK